MPALYASENNLLLSHVLPFAPNYNLSAYQFRDRPFALDKESDMYIFTKSDDGVIVTVTVAVTHEVHVPRDIQMYSYFSLFIALPTTLGDCNEQTDGEPRSDDGQLWSTHEILDKDFVHNIVKANVPDGIRSEIKQWRILREKTCDKAGGWKVAEYQVVLFGERKPITLRDAEIHKAAIEDEVQLRTVGTRRGGWNVSNALPSSILRARGW